MVKKSRAKKRDIEKEKLLEALKKANERLGKILREVEREND
jgi:cell fate (sporulation/competence/biofilm development) regulator YlbF (YheA/YmcA/DUF963 family)